MVHPWKGCVEQSTESSNLSKTTIYTLIKNPHLNTDISILSYNQQYKNIYYLTAIWDKI